MADNPWLSISTTPYLSQYVDPQGTRDPLQQLLNAQNGASSNSYPQPALLQKLLMQGLPSPYLGLDRDPASGSSAPVQIAPGVKQSASFKVPVGQMNPLVSRATTSEQNQRVQDSPYLSQEADALATQKAQLEKYRKDFKPEIDLSGLLPLISSMSGVDYASGYKAPETQQQHDLMVQKLQDALGKGQGEYAQRATQFVKGQDDSKLLGMQIRAMQANAKANDPQKEDKYVDATLNNINDQLDAYKGRAGNFGNMAKIKYAANRVNRVIYDSSGGIKNLSNPQIEDVALATGSLLAGGNAGTEAQIKALLPKGYGTDVASIKDFFTNDANPADQQKFLKTIGDMATAQAQLADDSMKEVAVQRMFGTHQRFREKYKPEYSKALRGHGLDYVNGQIKLLEDPGTPQESAPASGLSSEDQQAVNWAKSNRGNADAEQILKLHGIK